MADAIDIYRQVTQVDGRISVTYLILSGQEYRTKGKLLAAGTDPIAYGDTNQDALFADGNVLLNGAVLAESIRERSVKDLHEQALLVARQVVRQGGTLQDVLDAMQTVYVGETRITDFLTDIYITFRNGTEVQQNQFIVFMLYILTARGASE